MNNLLKARLAIVSILVLILLATLIVGLGVYRIRLEKQKANLYAVGEAALAAHQWNEALAQFEALSALERQGLLQPSTRSQPPGPPVGWGSVQRGGSWYSPLQHVSTTFRNMTHCYAPIYRVGFRCARSAD